MVKAGKPVDSVIEQLVPLLEAGDIIIDAGNSHYEDTRRREAALRQEGPALRRHRRLRRRGGRPATARPSCRAVPRSPTTPSARCWKRSPRKVDGQPCCAWIGTDGAGHYVKMVHNGIEYGDMQVIGEAYDLLRSGAGIEPAEQAKIFDRVEQGRPRLLPDRNHRRGPRPRRCEDRQAVRRRRRGRRRPEGHRPLDGHLRPGARLPDVGHRRVRLRPGPVLPGRAARAGTGAAGRRRGRRRGPARASSRTSARRSTPPSWSPTPRAWTCSPPPPRNTAGT